MIDIQNKEKCSGCHACMATCPTNCITMQKDAEGFLYPVVDETQCIRCGKCEKVCPVLNVTQANCEKQVDAYAAVYKDEQVRSGSSSGGLFFALAVEILKEKGVVFGAAFDEKGQVIHTYVETEENLPKLMGSKYLQSTIGDSYKQAQNFLRQGRKVMFVGTPCQIEGLKTFLQVEYTNLLCIDIVCHGVPSPKLWERYIAEKEKSYGAKIQKISFRDKTIGWRAYSMRMDFSNGKQYKKTHEEDAYMRLFLSNICLRPSCYNCSFKKINRRSDITLADCWGIEKLITEKDDDKGTSLLFIHSLKGQKAFHSVSRDCHVVKVDEKKAVLANPSMIQSSSKPSNRTLFFEELETIRFKKAVKKYVPYQKRTLKEKVVVLLKKVGVWKALQKIRHKQ